ncbi:MAG: hypothetical protein RIG82_03500 [Phycisphaeraceae bacterium]
MTRLALILVALMAVAGCEAVKSMDVKDLMDLSFGADVEKFTFNTGGDTHAEGFGGWKVSFDRAGSIKLAHTLSGQSTDFEPYALTPDQAKTLWAVIDRLPFKKLSKSAKNVAPVPPGTTMYAFNWTIDGKPHTATLPSTEALKNSGVNAMVSVLEPLIHDATGIQPTLK